mgnify:CR=1 FL=1
MGPRRREVSARWQSTTYTTSARFATPTYRVDQLERYLAWYEKY